MCRKLEIDKEIGKDETAKVKEIVEYFNEKSGRKVSPTSRTNYNPIMRLLRRNYNMEDFKSVMDLKSIQWLNNPKMKMYFRIETLFNSANFKKYLQESKIKGNYVEAEEIIAIKKVDDDLEKFEKEYLKMIKMLKNMDYGDYLLTNHWKFFRHEAMIHFNFKCQVCGTTENLVIHHNNYKNRGRETFNDVICLCSKCHGKIHEEISEV